MKLLKCQVSKIIQSEGFLGKLLTPLMKSDLSLMKNVIKSLAKSFLIPLRLTAAPFISGTTTLITPNK